MVSPDLKFLHAFNCVRGVGAQTLRTLKNAFGTFEQAWRETDSTLSQIIPRESVRYAIREQRKMIHPDRAMADLVRKGVWMIAKDDSMFPARLREIPHTPLALYGTGDIRSFHDANNAQCIMAVVGTRRPTRYGYEACETITRELAESGCAIVSGLALGIDACAHSSALASKGRTVAVLGSGVDEESLFPQENKILARRISGERGAVVSEYAPGTPALREHFPARNRIISGLSRGVLVVEAREKSGALITARFALDQNREVFALPGSIFSPTSRGPHALIREGARIAEGARDILEEFGIASDRTRNPEETALAPHEKTLLDLLEEPLTVDDLKAQTRYETSRIMSSLSLLELKGLVRSLGQDTYQKIAND